MDNDKNEITKQLRSLKRFVGFMGIILMACVLSVGVLVLLILPSDVEDETMGAIEKRFENCEVSINGLQESFDGKFAALTATVENQSVLINRTVGKISPLIVPETYQKTLNEIENKCKKASLITESTGLNDLESDYLVYVNSTPPWIQEEQIAQLLKTRFYLQYAKTRYMYNNEELDLYETERVMTSILFEQPDSLDKRVINEAEIFHSKIINEISVSEKTITEEAINELLVASQPYLEKSSKIEPGSVEILLDDMEPYLSKSTKIKDRVEKLNSILTDYKVSVLVKEYQNEGKQIKDAYGRSSWDTNRAIIFIEGVAELKGISHDLDAEKKAIELLVKRNEYGTRLSDFKNRYEKAKDLTGEDELTVLHIIRTELSYMIVEIKASQYDLSSEEKEAENIFNNLEKEESTVQQELIDTQKDAIKEYNEWAFGLVKEVSEKLDSNEKPSNAITKKGKAEHKAYYDEKIRLSLKLLEIDMQYLYEPIAKVYYEVYESKLMEFLESKHKYIIAKKSLNIKRKGLGSE